MEQLFTWLAKLLGGLAERVAEDDTEQDKRTR